MPRHDSRRARKDVGRQHSQPFQFQEVTNDNAARRDAHADDDDFEKGAADDDAPNARPIATPYDAFAITPCHPFAATLSAVASDIEPRGF